MPARLTIREYVARRQTLVRTVGVLGALIVIIACVVAFPRWISTLGPAALILCLLPVGLVMYAIERSVRCPRCKENLATLTGASVDAEAMNEVCPHCGVRLDEPMDR